MENREWRCFHCDEVFMDEDEALLHFGSSECSEPACRIKAHERGLVKKYRELEDELSKWQAEFAEEQLIFYRNSSRRTQSIIDAEEAGYAQGVADGRKAQMKSDELAELLAGLAEFHEHEVTSQDARGIAEFISEEAVEWLVSFAREIEAEHVELMGQS